MRHLFLICLTAALVAGCATNTSAPRTVLPGITDPTETRDLGSGNPRQPPRVLVLLPSEGARLVFRQVEVLVQASGEGALRVDVNGVPAVPDAATGRFRATLILDEGPSVPITARVEDAFGQVARHGILVAVDSTPPDVQARSKVVVAGSVDSHDTQVTVNGTPVPVGRDLSWETVVRLPADLKVTIVATDSFGNQTVKLLDYSKP